MSSPALKAAVSELGKYFGVRGADTYLQQTVGSVGPSFTEIVTTVDSAGEVVGLINDIIGLGDASMSVAHILARCKEISLNDDELLKRMNRYLCFTVSDDSLVDEPEALPLNAQKVPVPGEGVFDTSQGMFLPENGKFYTVDDYAVVDRSPEAKPETKVHVIQVFPASANIANSDVDVTALFMNSIPTLELTRAVPVVDILVLVKGDPEDRKMTRSMSLGRFLLGADMTGEEAPTPNIFTAETPHVAAGIERSDIASAEAGEDLKPQFMTAAAMEIFTSPQTMVPTNPDGTLRVHRVEGDQAPLDPFRPLMSLTSMTVNMVNASGMQSYRSADLSLVLHDRSQLAVVTPLVSPGEINNIKLEITYGWSHPDGTSAYGRGRPSDATHDNRFAELINSMRVTELFAVQNSEFSFEDDGSVSINLKLSTAGETSIQTLDVTFSEVVDAYGELGKITNQIKKRLNAFRKKNAGDGELNIPTELQRATNASSAAVLKKKDISAINKYLRKGGGGDLKAIGVAIGKLQEAQKVAAGSKERAVKAMIKHIKNTPDPFLRPVGAFGKGMKRIITGYKLVLVRSAEESEELRDDYNDNERDLLDRLNQLHANKAWHAAHLNARVSTKTITTVPGEWPWSDDVEVVSQRRDAGGLDEPAIQNHIDEMGIIDGLIINLEMQLEELGIQVPGGPLFKRIPRYADVNIFDEKHKAEVGRGGWRGRSKHVSLGKLLSYFVGMTVAHTEQFDEVQMIFYAFNDSASYLHDCNIAQFPIRIEEFESVMNEHFSNTGRMSIRELLSMLDRDFIRSETAPGYGFVGEIYEKKRDKKGEIRVKKKAIKGVAKGKQARAIRGKKEEVLRKAYGLDKSESQPGVEFKMPQINLHIEAVPMRPTGDKSILKIHVTDQKCTSSTALQNVLKGFMRNGVAKSITRRGPDLSPRGSDHQSIYSMQMKELEAHNLITGADDFDVKLIAKSVFGETTAFDEAGVRELLSGMHIIESDAMSRIKKFYSSMFPTFTYGSIHSAIITAKLASENNSLLATARMVGAGKKIPGATGIDDGLPMSVTPTSLSLETFGCPYFSIGQHYFVDFLTDTTADNFYNVSEVTHNLEPGKFTTSVRMNTMSTFGKWESTTDNLKDLIAGAGRVAQENDQVPED